MSLSGQLDLRNLIASKRKTNGPGFVRFGQKPELTEPCFINSPNKTKKGKVDLSASNIQTTLANMLFAQEANTSSLFNALRLGPYTYFHAPKDFEQIFEFKAGGIGQRYIDMLKPEIEIVSRKEDEQDEEEDEKQDEGEDVDSLQTKKITDNSNSRKNTKGQRKERKKRERVTATTTTTTLREPRTKPGTKIFGDADKSRLAAIEFAKISMHLTLKFSKILNRKNSKFFKNIDGGEQRKKERMAWHEKHWDDSSDNSGDEFII